MYEIIYVIKKTYDFQFQEALALESNPPEQWILGAPAAKIRMGMGVGSRMRVGVLCDDLGSMEAVPRPPAPIDAGR